MNNHNPKEQDIWQSESERLVIPEPKPRRHEKLLFMGQVVFWLLVTLLVIIVFAARFYEWVLKIEVLQHLSGK